jgi:hypothetical protein
VYVCAHCQFTVVNNPPAERTTARAWCAQCDAYICQECAARMAVTLECRNFAKRLDQACEELERFGTATSLLTRL